MVKKGNVASIALGKFWQAHVVFDVLSIRGFEMFRERPNKKIAVARDFRNSYCLLKRIVWLTLDKLANHCSGA